MTAGPLRGLVPPRLFPSYLLRVAFHRSTAAREAGPAAIVVLVVVWGAIWVALRPLGQGGTSYVGQLSGAESILLLSIALVLISTLPWVEV